MSTFATEFAAVLDGLKESMGESLSFTPAGDGQSAQPLTGVISGFRRDVAAEQDGKIITETAQCVLKAADLADAAKLRTITTTGANLPWGLITHGGVNWHIQSVQEEAGCFLLDLVRYQSIEKSGPDYRLVRPTK